MYKRMSEQTKANIVSELAAGTKVSDIAKKFNVRAGAVYNLKSRAKTNTFKTKTVLRKNTSTNKTVSEVDVLKAENAFLKTKVEFLSKK